MRCRHRGLGQETTIEDRRQSVVATQEAVVEIAIATDHHAAPGNALNPLNEHPCTTLPLSGYPSSRSAAFTTRGISRRLERGHEVPVGTVVGEEGESIQPVRRTQLHGRDQRQLLTLYVETPSES